VLPQLYGLDNIDVREEDINENIGKASDQKNEPSEKEEVIEENNNNNEGDIMIRTTREPQQSIRLRYFITYKVKKVKYPIQNFLSYNQISPQYISFFYRHFKKTRTCSLS
jgi:hypothetical protein